MATYEEALTFNVSSKINETFLPVILMGNISTVFISQLKTNIFISSDKASTFISSED